MWPSLFYEMITFRDLFDYDHNTGELIRKEWPREMYSSDHVWRRINKKHAGSRITCKHYDHGRPTGIIFGKVLGEINAHRAIWIMHHGPIPPGMHIDHRDGDPFNNRLANLRLVTHQQNMYNKNPYKTNKSGHKGVCWDKKENRWVAQINVEGRHKRIGAYKSLDEAVSAYIRESLKEHGEYAYAARGELRAGGKVDIGSAS